MAAHTAELKYVCFLLSLTSNMFTEHSVCSYSSVPALLLRLIQKTIIIKSNIEKSKPKTMTPDYLVRKNGFCLQSADNVSLWSERASVCVSGVQLRVVMDQATSLETTLHIEGRRSSPVLPAAPSDTLHRKIT